MILPTLNDSNNGVSSVAPSQQGGIIKSRVRRLSRSMSSGLSPNRLSNRVLKLAGRAKVPRLHSFGSNKSSDHSSKGSNSSSRKNGQGKRKRKVAFDLNANQVMTIPGNHHMPSVEPLKVSSHLRDKKTHLYSTKDEFAASISKSAALIKDNVYAMEYLQCMKEEFKTVSCCSRQQQQGKERSDDATEQQSLPIIVFRPVMIPPEPIRQGLAWGFRGLELLGELGSVRRQQISKHVKKILKAQDTLYDQAVDEKGYSKDKHIQRHVAEQLRVRSIQFSHSSLHWAILMGAYDANAAKEVYTQQCSCCFSSSSTSRSESESFGSDQQLDHNLQRFFVKQNIVDSFSTTPTTCAASTSLPTTTKPSRSDTLSTEEDSSPVSSFHASCSIGDDFDDLWIGGSSSSFDDQQPPLPKNFLPVAM